MWYIKVALIAQSQLYIQVHIWQSLLQHFCEAALFTHSPLHEHRGIGLHQACVSNRRKVAFLSKLELLCQNKDSLCCRIFTSLAIENVCNTFLVQQWRILKSQFGTYVVAKCLHDQENATSIVSAILQKGYIPGKIITNSYLNHSHTTLQQSSLPLLQRLLDMALDRGTKGASKSKCERNRRLTHKFTTSAKVFLAVAAIHTFACCTRVLAIQLHADS